MGGVPLPWQAGGGRRERLEKPRVSAWAHHPSASGFHFLQDTSGASSFHSELEIPVFLYVNGENSSHFPCLCLNVKSVIPSLTFL